MKMLIKKFCITVLFVQLVAGCSTLNPTSESQYRQAKSSPWDLKMLDSGTESWAKYWTRDGKVAHLRNTEDGLVYKAGPQYANHAHHEVLWTKQVFQGDIKIEYNYTRLDDTIKAVTILYVYAQGEGGEYPADISLWADRREEPYMSKYFKNMHLYHISYAAFDLDNSVRGADYIRARRYLPVKANGLKGTDLKPDYFKTGLFEPGIKHKITVIKKGTNLFMHIDNGDKKLLAHWDTSIFPDLNRGRVGLRHMFTRNALYSDFKISTLRK